VIIIVIMVIHAAFFILQFVYLQTSEGLQQMEEELQSAMLQVQSLTEQKHHLETRKQQVIVIG